MSTPTANLSATTPVANNIATPGSHASPTPNHHASPQIPATTAIAASSTPQNHKRDVAVVFVVDGTARMKPHFNILYEAYVEPIIK
jgi:hypothetical protein